MEHKLTKLYYIALFIGIILSILIAVFANNEVFDANSKEAVTDWTKTLTPVKEGNVTVYEIKLPDEDLSDKSLAIYLSHTELDVTVADQLVYSVKKVDDPTIKTNGYSWNFVTLHQQYAGEPMTITLRSTYASTSADAIIYYGQRSMLMDTIISKDLLRTSVALIIILIGIIAMIYSIFIVGRNYTDESLLQFALFAILLGTWLFSDSSICALILPWSVAHVYFTHVSLMCMPISFLLFLKNTYQDSNHPLWMVGCGINYFVVILRLLLQITGIYDFRESLWMTHVYLILFIIIIVYLSIRELILNKMTKQMRTNIICIFLIMATTIMDLIYYNLTHKSSSFGALGFLLFTFIMGINMIKNSHKMMERAKESEVYRKLAYTDELTGLFNRTAFKQDMDRIQKVNPDTQKMSISPTVIFMLDLNDLKKCNDNYGHDCGDKYICIAADIIKHVFEDDGRCYRIGGDEFCIVFPFVSNNDIVNKMELLRRRLKEQNRKPFVVPVSIAAGYAIYDAAIDKSLDDTRNRADEMMYEDKQMQKRKNTPA